MELIITIITIFFYSCNIIIYLAPRPKGLFNSIVLVVLLNLGRRPRDQYTSTTQWLLQLHTKAKPEIGNSHDEAVVITKTEDIILLHQLQNMQIHSF